MFHSLAPPSEPMSKTPLLPPVARHLGRLPSCHLVLISFRAAESEEGPARPGERSAPSAGFFFFKRQQKAQQCHGPSLLQEQSLPFSKHKDYFIMAESAGAEGLLSRLPDSLLL